MLSFVPFNSYEIWFILAKVKTDAPIIAKVETEALFIYM